MRLILVAAALTAFAAGVPARGMLGTSAGAQSGCRRSQSEPQWCARSA